MHSAKNLRLGVKNCNERKIYRSVSKITYLAKKYAPGGEITHLRKMYRAGGKIML